MWLRGFKSCVLAEALWVLMHINEMGAVTLNKQLSTKTGYDIKWTKKSSLPLYAKEVLPCDSAKC